MGECRVDGKNSPPVESPEEMVGRFQAELITALPGWKERLTTNPGQLPELEREVQVAFSRGADLLIVGLLAVVMKNESFDDACERTRGDFAYPLERGRPRPIRVQLLGGLLIWVTSLYCAPRRTRTGNTDEKVPGVHVELKQFEEFRILFADHLHRHFFNEGLLMRAATIERLDRISAPIDCSVIPSSTSMWTWPPAVAPP